MTTARPGPDDLAHPPTGADGTGRAGSAAHPARDALAALVDRGVRWGWDDLPLTGRPAAVLVLVGVLDDVPAQRPAGATDEGRAPADLDVLLVARSHTLTHHAGQVAFPGGRVDPDDDGVVGAALREAAEETGLDETGVDVLGTLEPIPVPVSDHLVTPVVAWWSSPSPVGVVDHGESRTVFRVPLADLAAPANRWTTVFRRGGVDLRSPSFEVAGHVVWGFTAFVLDRLLAELGWEEPWDRSRTRPVPR